MISLDVLKKELVVKEEARLDALAISNKELRNSLIVDIDILKTLISNYDQLDELAFFWEKQYFESVSGDGDSLPLFTKRIDYLQWVLSDGELMNDENC